jgi:hypothetical protein
MSDPSHHGQTPATAGDDEHAFDGIPTDTPGPDEPRTPGWLTLLGVALVLSLLFLLALRSPDEQDTAEGVTAEPSAVAAAAPAPEVPDQRRPDRAPAARPARPTLPPGFPGARPGRPTGPAGRGQPGAAPAPHQHAPGEPPH